MSVAPSTEAIFQQGIVKPYFLSACSRTDDGGGGSGELEGCVWTGGDDGAVKLGVPLGGR